MSVQRFPRRPAWPKPLRTGSRIGLAPRLFLACGLVILAGACTLLVVALLLAPPLFRGHLQQAGARAVPPDVQGHIDEAFGQALLISLAAAVLAAALAAGAISWLVSRRLAAPVEEISREAQRLADGRYDTVVPDPRLGPEFRTLARSMNQLSVRLAEAEGTRRRLTADLAHQLRTPLASVQATVEALADGVLAPDRRALSTLTDQTARLRRLVADLERVSRAEERQLMLRPSVLELGRLAERCAAALTPSFRGKGVELAVVADPATPTVRVDADRMAEALTNVLENALRHTPGGGQVIISVSSPSTDGHPARSARIEVQDTGEGFDPVDAERLFERFYRAPSAAGADSGSGIGLTIARAIVEAHGGQLRARSCGPATGATFTVVLPAVGAG
jgi:two-component system sensor histidine kinase BaeS